MLHTRLSLLCLLAASCTGLHLDQGNAFPCDFSLGPGARDQACVPGDVCGVDNLCRAYLYEGPRFEGKPTVPTFGASSGEGAVVHPLRLDREVREVLADLPLGRSERAYVRDDLGFHELEKGQLTGRRVTLPTQLPPGFGAIEAAQPYLREGRANELPEVLLRDRDGHLAVGSFELPRAAAVQTDGGPISGAAFRVVTGPFLSADGGARLAGGALPLAWTATELGLVYRATALPPTFRFAPMTGTPEPLFDVAVVTPARLWLVALDAEGVSLLDARDGGALEPAASLDPMSATGGRLSTDPEGRIVAAARRAAFGPLPNANIEVLSTLQVNLSAEGVSLLSPWLDCSPCGANRTMELISPSLRSGAPTVELLCRGVSGGLEAVRVIGSNALSQFDACLIEPLELPVEAPRLAHTAAAELISWSGQGGLLVGGAQGEVWSGDALSTLRPLYLDRVPWDVAPAFAGRRTSLAAITDDSLFFEEPEELPADERNGLRRVAQRELGVSESARLAGFVHEVNGWGVTSLGEVVRLRVGPSIGIDPGPLLVAANGDPIRDSIGGEAFTDADGGAIAFFVAADDSLYFVPDPVGSLGADEPRVLSPDLTPEPSVPIRSLALERTPLGTDGKTAARGYLVTSRNVYQWQLGGAPARWSASQVLLGGGQPVEVWFDSKLSALGRVGYSSGEIYTLPSGYQLAEALPGSKDDVPAQVLDYENLGGWPVAYTTIGLFIAGWDVNAEGKLENRFADGSPNRPMSWRRVTLPDGSEPWMKTERLQRRARSAKLFVVQDPRDPADQLRPFRLLVFLDDKVVQVATHRRK